MEADLAGIEHPVETIDATRDFMTKILENGYKEYWLFDHEGMPPEGFQYQTHFKEWNFNGKEGMSLVKQIEDLVFGHGDNHNYNSMDEPY